MSFLDGPSQNVSGKDLADGLEIVLGDQFSSAVVLVESVQE
ncbi:hypothetical protein PSQ19_02395 [Devosia algicola]|uniref:Uncharacterized protein n=1 Tax=Devosia algicola TaxID=3026418 RepID=A0ABY7YPJ6_9HYPH|nr:hypothetical protein [Devosia algicola]WDR03073.1 hypothetical protein PSQ19_02395 [Devosia algicola]